MQVLMDRMVSHEKLATIGKVSGMIAHELRNPLGTVRNAVYLLKRKLSAERAKIQDYLKIIEDEVDRSNRIISGLLDVAKIKSPKKHLVPLCEIVESAKAYQDCPHGIEFDLDLEDDRFELFADQLQMTQVFGNLIKNSLDVLKESGAIKITAFRQGGEDLVTVSDSGNSIDTSHRRYIFDPLYTTKTIGSGLGLSICKEIIERHGGSIRLLENFKDGTAFEIRLPHGDDA